MADASRLSTLSTLITGTPGRKPLLTDREAHRALRASNAQKLIDMFPAARIGYESNPDIGTIPFGNFETKSATILGQMFRGGYGDKDLLEEESLKRGVRATPAAYSKGTGIIFGRSGSPRMGKEGLADINSVAKVAVHEFMHVAFKKPGISRNYAGIETPIGIKDATYKTDASDGKRIKIRVDEELLIRLLELRRGIISEEEVARKMHKDATAKDARMLLRHSGMKKILTQIEQRANEYLAGDQ